MPRPGRATSAFAVLVLLAGLTPRETHTLTAERTDALGRRWVASARYEADEAGVIDPARQPPVAGSYEGGYSKGAELALVVASRRPDVGAVVAYAPGSAVFQGFRPPRFPTISSWSLGGEPLAFVPNAYDDRFFDTFDGMYLWYRTLAQHEAVAAAAIEVEKIACDVLLLSGVEEKTWPATYMAEQIMGRLYLAEFPHQARHLPFPRAGHGIAAPPGEPTTSVAERLGGTAAGNAAARAAGWRAVEELLAGLRR